MINEALLENKHFFLHKVVDDKNETIEELTKRVEGLEAKINKTKHTGGIFDRLSQ